LSLARSPRRSSAQRTGCLRRQVFDHARGWETTVEATCTCVAARSCLCSSA
jgi:hypothetical protein